MRPSASIAFAALLVFACGCERGCAKNAIDRARHSGAAPVASQPFPLAAVDCPDGLARCKDGVVETSRLFAYPVPCTGPAERCTCPWDRLAECDRGCAAPEIELVLPRDRALIQLCAPPPAQSFARPPGPDAAVPPGACGGELYRCLAGLVVQCETDDGAPHGIAACAHGCAEEGAFLDDARITRDQAVALMCRR